MGLSDTRRPPTGGDEAASFVVVEGTRRGGCLRQSSLWGRKQCLDLRGLWRPITGLLDFLLARSPQFLMLRLHVGHDRIKASRKCDSHEGHYHKCQQSSYYRITAALHHCPHV
ncbi:MAG: hypothetical protein ACYTEK_26695 [Planctomycetota bacterium]